MPNGQEYCVLNSAVKQGQKKVRMGPPASRAVRSSESAEPQFAAATDASSGGSGAPQAVNRRLYGGRNLLHRHAEIRLIQIRMQAAFRGD
jgi:hypothetical protein